MLLPAGVSHIFKKPRLASSNKCRDTIVQAKAAVAVFLLFLFFVFLSVSLVAIHRGPALLYSSCIRTCLAIVMAHDKYTRRIVDGELSQFHSSAEGCVAKK